MAGRGGRGSALLKALEEPVRKPGAAGVTAPGPAGVTAPGPAGDVPMSARPVSR